MKTEILVEIHGSGQSSLETSAVNWVRRHMPALEVTGPAVRSGLRCPHGYVVWSVPVKPIEDECPTSP